MILIAPRLTDDFFQLKIRDTNRPFFKHLARIRNGKKVSTYQAFG